MCDPGKELSAFCLTSEGEDSRKLVLGVLSEPCPLCFFPLLILFSVLSL